MKEKITSAVLLLISFHISLLGVGAQSIGQGTGETEVGIPFIQNFTPEEYQFFPSNWAIVQDRRGIMFIANSLGLLEYDGVTWRRHELLSNSTITALDIDKQGTIYLGGRLDFGYLVPDSSGNFNFVSLAKNLKRELQNFTIVREVSATSHGIYFRSPKCIFRWHDAKLTTLPGNYQYMTAIRDTLYVAEKGKGLRRLEGDSLQTVPGGERLASTTTYVIIPFIDNSILLGTSTEGLYIFNGHSVEPFRTEADDFLRRARLYHGAKLSATEPLWVLGTTNAGLIIINKQGRIIQILNKASGILDDKIHFVFRDRQGALWLSQNNGISRIEFPSPFSIFDERLGLVGTPYAIARHEGRIYIGSSRGLFWLTSGIAQSPGESGQPDILSLSKFKPVSELSSKGAIGIPEQVWSLLSVEDDLLVGSAERIYKVRGNDFSVIAQIGGRTRCLYQPPDRYDIAYAGLNNGLGLLKKTAGNWEFKGRISGINEEILTMVQEKPGILWLGTAVQRVLRVETREESLTADVVRYGGADGLPQGWSNVGLLNDRPVVMTWLGLHRFNPDHGVFEPDRLQGGLTIEPDWAISHLVQEESGKIWMMAGAEKGSIYFSDRDQAGEKFWQNTPFQRMVGMKSLMEIMPEEDGMVWFVGRNQRIYRFDSNYPVSLQTDYQASVRQVVSLKADSVLWGGTLLPEQNEPALLSALPFEHNSIRLEYAATNYTESASNQYRIMLEGYDDNWSRWTGETRKDYTGLPAGDYSFRVRAKNLYGHLAKEAQFALSILPPWYQQWWAYLIYLLGGVGFIALIVKTRVQHLEKKTKELEGIIAERTGVIQEQADKLKELDKMKSRFFANISHEFRTPITLILGPLQDMIDKAKSKPQKDELNLMQRNANRLLQLINQLLDLSRLESGKMKLQVGRGDLLSFLKGIVMSFASLAEQKNIILRFDPCEDSKSSQGLSDVYFDPDHIEKIFSNLLSNAFKFTPAGGTVSVTMHNIPLNPPSKGDLKESPLERSIGGSGTEGVIEIIIKDTGIGIPADRLTHIFDRFYQVDASATREQEGTGIGLALTKELVELHHGEIEVDSVEGQGTEFIVRLPIGREHFKVDEIVEGSDGELEAPDIISKTEKPEAVSEAQLGEEEPSPILMKDEEAPLILIIDDHSDVRNYIKMHLQNDFQIIEAKNGKDGLSAAIETIPDIIVSDVMMPQMDGFQLCEALKTDEKTSHIPVILLTAKAGDKDKLEGLETGADDYLTKPFNSKELQVRIRNLIEIRHKLQDRFRKEGLLQPRDISVTSVEEAFIQKLMSIFEERMSEEDFGVEQLSDALYMSRKQLQRKVRGLTGETPTDFMRSVRLQRAKQLLEKGAGSVSEIAFMTGFGSLSYFSTAFREKFGKSPSAIKVK